MIKIILFISKKAYNNNQKKINSLTKKTLALIFNKLITNTTL